MNNGIPHHLASVITHFNTCTSCSADIFKGVLLDTYIDVLADPTKSCICDVGKGLRNDLDSKLSEVKDGKLSEVNLKKDNESIVTVSSLCSQSQESNVSLDNIDFEKVKLNNSLYDELSDSISVSDKSVASPAPGTSSPKTSSPLFYRTVPLDQSKENISDNASYIKAPTNAICTGEMAGKLVEVEGHVTRCHNVNDAIKLLNLSDTHGVCQLTLKGDLVHNTEELKRAELISVKGRCDRRRFTKLQVTRYELIVHSWRIIRQGVKRDLNDSYNDIRYSENGELKTPEKLHTALNVRAEPSRKVTTSTDLSVTPCSMPPPLVSLDGRSTVSYSPTVYLDDIGHYKHCTVTTWGHLTIGGNHGVLSNGKVDVTLYFSNRSRMKTQLVYVEGSPFFDDNKRLSIAVKHIYPLDYRRLPCLKFLASTPQSIFEEKGKEYVKRIAELPKIVNGAELVNYYGEFTMMRAKLIFIKNHDNTDRPTGGKVVCSDSSIVNISFAPFYHKFNSALCKLDDQVVLVGKVDNKHSSRSPLPWLTVEHMQVIRDKETDVRMGFTKTAFYEILKQVVIETLKSEDVPGGSTDPWSFLQY